MILAAGLGTRLRPITDGVPKALVEVDGVPMLERVARRLVAAGADRLIVNVHHRAERIEAFVAGLDLGAEVRISREPDGPLGTGGGVLRAAPHFRRDAPFFLHNVDVVSDLDLGALYADHARRGDAVATLAVGRRETDRLLLFDGGGLYGWENVARGTSETVRGPRGRVERWPFAGVHVVSPALFDRGEPIGDEVREPFSIVAVYLGLAAAGERIVPWDVGRALWLEVGTPERLERARRELAARSAGA